MASFTVPCPKCLSPARLGLNSQNPQLHTQKLSFQNCLSVKPRQAFGSLLADPGASGFQNQNRKQFSGWKLQAQLNEATIENSSNSSPVLATGSGAGTSEKKDDQNGKPSGPSTIADTSSISAFMTQVSDLVKLVDSRDIMELQLKQSDCEIVIRKKEALQPPPATTIAHMSPPVHYPALPSQPPAAAAASAPASLPPSKPAPALPSPGNASTSSHAPLKCPMAGTFYRSPAPGEPPFVKVGDKVQKGQVICIIEAMKLMNEIEADQSGTVTEVLAEDGKPVGVDTPLFLIAP